MADLTPWGRPGNATAIARFLAKVDKSAGPDGCWPWTGAISSTGYGAFRTRPDHLVSAHVFALELHLGRRLNPGDEACHHCDYRPCCNFGHLYVGTRQSNIADAFLRNRIKYGSARRGSRLLERQVIEIRERFAAGEASPALAAEFGVSQPTISRVVNGHGWAHVGGPIREDSPLGRRFPQKTNGAI